MTFSHAIFVFDDDPDQLSVEFGTDSCIVQQLSGHGAKTLFEVDNRDRRYWPCVAHAKDLIRLATQKEPKTNQAPIVTPAPAAWQTEQPPNEQFVEVRHESGSVTEAAAYYGRDGTLPHWRQRNGTCVSPEMFREWRPIPEPVDNPA